MNIPGFTAEGSLYKSTGYHVVSLAGDGIEVGLIEAAQAPIGWETFDWRNATPIVAYHCPAGTFLIRSTVPGPCLEQRPVLCTKEWQPLDPSNPSFGGRMVITCD